MKLTEIRNVILKFDFPGRYGFHFVRDRAAAIRCISGRTQFLPILSRALASRGVRVVIYIGDVFEESAARGRKLADAMGARGIRLIVLHDVADWLARRDAEQFQDLARRTGGCVLPFDANAPDRLSPNTI